MGQSNQNLECLDGSRNLSEVLAGRWAVPHFALFSLLLLGVGCAAPVYHLGAKRPPVARLVEDESMVERGKPRPVIDGIGWVFGIPGKIILWDRRVDNHHVSPCTENAIVGYLAENQMPDVKVRVNQYDPGGEWHRLWRNDKVGVGWRATFGLVGWAGYTIFPGRIFGGDAYNPYTHSIYLYSDVPAIALHEGGHAKDFASRDWPGTYAAVGLLPFTSLYVEAVATQDALGYLASQGRQAELADACRILYPAYGTYVGGEIIPWIWPDGSLFASAIGAIPGHVVGWSASRRIRRELGLRPLPPTPALNDAGGAPPIPEGPTPIPASELMNPWERKGGSRLQGGGLSAPQEPLSPSDQKPAPTGTIERLPAPQATP